MLFKNIDIRKKIKIKKIFEQQGAAKSAICRKIASIAFSQAQLLIDKVLTQRKLGSRIVQLILALLALNHFAQVFQGVAIF